MAIGEIPPERTFLRMDPSDESGSEVNQDEDLWEKIRENFDFTEVLNSGSAQAVVGSHFYSAIRPWFLADSVTGAGSTVTYGFNNKHQVKLTSGPAAGRAAMITLNTTAGQTPSDAFIRFHDVDWPSVYVEWRFSVNITAADHEIWIGYADSPVVGSDPTNYIVLKSVPTGYEYRSAGIFTAGNSTIFTIDNNDNGVTYISARIALMTDTAIWYGLYDKDADKRFIQKFSKGQAFATASVAQPFFKIKTISGTVVGDVLLDYFVQRPFSVLDLGTP